MPQGTENPSPASAGEPGHPVELLIHDFTNMLPSMLSGFAMIERRCQERSIKAIAVQGKKAAEDGLALTRRLKDMC